MLASDFTCKAGQAALQRMRRTGWHHLETTAVALLPSSVLKDRVEQLALPAPRPKPFRSAARPLCESPAYPEEEHKDDNNNSNNNDSSEDNCPPIVDDESLADEVVVPTAAVAPGTYS